MTNQLIDQGRPLFTPTSYWGPLHPGWATSRVLVREMANVPAVCKVDPAMRQAKGDKPKVAGGADVTAEAGGVQ